MFFLTALVPARGIYRNWVYLASLESLCRTNRPETASLYIAVVAVVQRTNLPRGVQEAYPSHWAGHGMTIAECTFDLDPATPNHDSIPCQSRTPGEVFHCKPKLRHRKTKGRSNNDCRDQSVLLLQLQDRATLLCFWLRHMVFQLFPNLLSVNISSRF